MSPKVVSLRWVWTIGREAGRPTLVTKNWFK